MSRSVRWGVLSTANIGVSRVIPSMSRMRNGRIVGIASRTLAQAESVAKALGLPRAYGSYEELLADPDIDAIYNPLPNHLHVPYTIRALEAGKHVLCEKPIAVTAAEAEQLINAADRYPRLKVMEAFMYRFHPQWETVFGVIRSGRIGEVRHVRAEFTYFNTDPANVRNQADLGGGGILDIGCYGVNLARWVFGAEPDDVTSTVRRDPVFGTDVQADAILSFGGSTAAVLCSTQLANHQSALIHGTKGRIVLDVPFNAGDDIPRTVTVTVGGTTETVRYLGDDAYTLQGEAFSQAILDGTPAPISLEDAIANMRVLDRIAARRP